MIESSSQKLISCVSLADMIGRSDEIARLESHAAGQSSENLLVVSGAPRVGVSEILRQVYDRVFLATDEILPIYFSIAESDRSASEIARRFAYELLLQFVAFKRRLPHLLDYRPDVNELVRTAGVSDAAFVDQVAELISAAAHNRSSEMIRTLFSLPLRFAAMGVRCFVIFDDVHRALYIDAGNIVTEAILEVCRRAEFPCIVAGRRRAVYKDFPDHRMMIDKLGFDDAGMLVETLAAKNGVLLNDQTRDLIVVQLDCDPTFITHVIERAAATNTPLDSFRSFESIYADEISGGKISRYYAKEFADAAGSQGLGRMLTAVSAKVAATSQNTAAAKKVRDRSGITESEFDRVSARLDAAELATVQGDKFHVETDCRALADYLEVERTLDIPGVSRAQAVGEQTAHYTKRAPHLMARHYRRLSAIGVAELMRTFEGREVPSAMLDYGKYRDDLKGREASEIVSRLADEKEVIALPRIVYTAHSSAYYRPIGEFVDTERSAVALGFEQDGGNDIAWLATELDSKLEASASLTEFWCDRLEMLAAHCDLSAYKSWLIAPEGFSNEALAVLNERGAIGSSRAQIELLKAHLGVAQADHSISAEQYQMTIPMGEDTEMLAVHLIEEIARRNDYPSSAINKIKTAVVEACINAAEHSLSPDRKINIGVTAKRDQIRISIENRGVGLAIKQAAATEESINRRGWGLTLIKNLMDELTFDQSDDGTRLVMSKIIER
jgi:serine/threonine-protein kinase RsbW